MSVNQTDDKAKPERLIHLNPSLYNPKPEEVEFLKKWTGIDDDVELKEHVLTVQREAWSVSSLLALRLILARPLADEHLFKFR